MAIARKVAEQMKGQSWIRLMFETGIALKKQFGEENVFDLSLGNPILEPPEAFKRELQRLASDSTPGVHRYMPNAGFMETRAAVAAQRALETGVPFTGADIIMTVGAAGALNVVFKSILEPGDEVIVFAPYFPEYLFYIDNHQGVPVIAQCDEFHQPDLADLARVLTPRTKAVLVNSPNNPTGAVYPNAAMRGIGEVLRTAEARFGTQVFLVSDEPYAKLLFDGIGYAYIHGAHTSTIGVTSYSKDLSLPGERIGYIAVPPDTPGHDDLMDGFTFSNRILGFVNAPAFMQRAIRALQGVAVDSGWYQQRRDVLCQRLIDLGFSLVVPQGAFYLFPKSPTPDDVAFVRQLQAQNVLVTPGSGFGAPGYFRISYSVPDRGIEGALKGFARVASG